MKVTLDTNVVVSGLLRAEGAAAAILREITAGRLQVCYDERIVAEYREVLLRPRFSFDPAAVNAFIELIEVSGLPVVCEPLGIELPDPDDAMFIEAARAGDVLCLITGNGRHFPPHLCSDVVIRTPRQFLEEFRMPDQS